MQFYQIHQAVGPTMKDYGFIFKDDNKMKKKAKVISDLTKDVTGIFK
jgi:succinate dehydrogenase/fumarate reductase flavoprotein subunit